MSTTEQWALLWSCTQNAIHIEPFAQTLSHNRRAYASDEGGDYRVLVVGSREEVEASADSIRGTLAFRQQQRRGLAA